MEYDDDEVFRPVNSKQSRSLQDILLGRDFQTKRNQQDELVISEDIEEEMVCSSVSLMGNESDLNEIFGRLAHNEQASKCDSTQIEILLMKLESAEKHNSELQHNLNSCTTANDQLKLNLIQLQKIEKENVETITSKLLIEQQEKQNELNSILMEKETIQEKLDKVKSDCAEFKHEAMAAKTECNRLKMELAMVRSEGVSVGSNLETLSQENAALRNQIEILKNDLSSHQQQHDSALSSAGNQISSLRQEVQERIQHLAKLNAELTGIERSNAILVAENSSLHQRVARLDSVERDLSQALWRVSALEGECRDLTAQNTMLRNAQHSAVAQSRDTHSDRLHSEAYGRYPSNSQQSFFPSSSYAPPPPPLSHNAHSIGKVSRDFDMAPAYSARTEFRDPEPSFHTPHNSLQSLATATGRGQTQQRGDAESSNNNSSHGSLAAVLGSRRVGGDAVANGSSRASGGAADFRSSPFATEHTSAGLQQQYQDLDRQLTQLMTEKLNLQDENEKLLQRGLKVLKDRTRLQQVELRLGELNKDIAAVRKKLTSKPS